MRRSVLLVWLATTGAAPAFDQTKYPDLSGQWRRAEPGNPLRIDCTNFGSGSYSIPHSVELTLAAMIFDGVLDRFPRLKFGAIELGASWVPGWTAGYRCTIRTPKSASLRTR